VQRCKLGHFDVSNGGRTATVVKGGYEELDGRSAGFFNNLICSAAPLVDGVFEYRIQQHARKDALCVGWAPASLDVESTYQYEKYGYYVNFFSDRRRYAQPGAVEAPKSPKHDRALAVRDGDTVVCRFDPRAGTISYHFPGEPAPAVAFVNVPAQPPLFPAVTCAFAVGTRFSFV